MRWKNESVRKGEKGGGKEGEGEWAGEKERESEKREDREKLWSVRPQAEQGP